jgi:hypothetical protein
MSENVKPIVRREDLVMAVAAARAAWVMSGISRDYCDSLPDKASRDLRWIPPTGAMQKKRQCGSVTGNRSLCVN